MNGGLGVARAVRGKCAGKVWKLHGERVESVCEVPGECVGSAREVSRKVFGEVLGSAELSASTCKAAR